MWKSLPPLIRSGNNAEILKSNFKDKLFSIPKISRYFIEGARVQSTYHCRIRSRCSSLNKDMYDNHS